MINAKFTLQTGASPDGLRFQVEDEISGLPLAEFKLTPEQIWDIVRGGFTHVEGTRTEHLDHVGKTMVVDTVSYSHDQLDAASIDYGDHPQHALYLAQRTFPNWDTYLASRMGGGHGGVKVVMRKWVDPSA